MRRQTKDPANVPALCLLGSSNARQITPFPKTNEETAKEEQLRQAQKMEAVGQLAAGVVHDFNNTLMTILMGLGMLRENPFLSPDTKESINEIERATARAINLTRQLLLFSRQQAARIEALDLNV